MAISVIGPCLWVERALPAAPVPRPPQPTRATWTVLLPAAWTWGMATPAKGEPLAKRLVFLINSRREVTVLEDSFITCHFKTLPPRCQRLEKTRYERIF